MTDSSLEKQKSPHIVSIHVLDNDSLLNIFNLYRPFFLGEDDGFSRLHGGNKLWRQGRWWYRLAHVCQRWRNLILGSASYLNLSLVCSNGTPVENMLAHSPPLPLTVDYRSGGDITAKDEEGLFLALEQRHRVRHFRLSFPAQNMRRLVMAIDEEFPILEYLIMWPSVKDNVALLLPESLQVPHLRHLTLSGFARPILHPAAASLATLLLIIQHQTAYFPPNVLLQWISFMPQLETLAISFTFPVPNRDVERQLTRNPITMHVPLLNLRLFWFQGVSAYLEAVVCQMTAPRLEILQIQLFEQLTFSVPRIPQFLDTTENLRFDNVVIKFQDRSIDVLMVLHEANMFPSGVMVDCRHLDWQISFVAQISNAFSQVFSAVEHLILEHGVHTQSSEEHNYVDRIAWRKIFSPFNNVKTLRVGDGLVRQLSHCLRPEDGELPLEVLPELQELTYSGTHDTGDDFTSFIDTRRDAGHPVTLICEAPNPNPSESSFELEAPASNDAGNVLDT